jgi:hypothetical protein
MLYFVDSVVLKMWTIIVPIFERSKYLKKNSLVNVVSGGSSTPLGKSHQIVPLLHTREFFPCLLGIYIFVSLEQ